MLLSENQIGQGFLNPCVLKTLILLVFYEEHPLKRFRAKLFGLSHLNQSSLQKKSRIISFTVSVRELINTLYSQIPAQPCYCFV